MTLQSTLACELGLHPITAQLLISRGIENLEEARIFLSPSLDHLPDPFELPDMERACERILTAMQKRETIAIYGDYDVDGCTSAALLTRFFRACGHDPIVFLPHRLRDGYGLSPTGIDILKERGARLIITVDNGMRAEEAIHYAVGKGMDVIVTDHHEGHESPQSAVAVVNPKQGGKISKDLCGVGLALFLAMALRRKLREARMLLNGEPHLGSLLDLVAIGTIADIVPLTNANRVLTSIGLDVLRRTTSVGLRALIQQAGLTSDQISTGTVAFRLAPRINAAGRLDDPMLALELLTTDNPERAAVLSTQLDKLNSERQRTEERVVQEALRIEEKSPSRGAIVAHAPHWHIGVVGIAGSKLVERCGLPAVVCGGEGPLVRGSVRSVRGLDILSCLETCADLLHRFGGHAQAAGVTIELAKLDTFRSRFADVCADRLQHISPPEVRVDAEVNPTEITEHLARDLERFEPFGMGNPEPVFLAHNIEVMEPRTVGDKHLKFTARAQRVSFDAIGFNLAENFIPPSAPCSLTFCPQLNTWNGTTRLQLKVKRMVPSS
ncbi:MAG: single-stranded-DNA-specific exonuclease RecJ [Deltaproteobacteria bacterium]|nr:single-stranded-DNA-specific exonuclease RecJ [Deltaproteobacteria bacterium]